MMRICSTNIHYMRCQKAVLFFGMNKNGNELKPRLFCPLFVLHCPIAGIHMFVVGLRWVFDCRRILWQTHTHKPSGTHFYFQLCAELCIEFFIFHTYMTNNKRKTIFCKFGKAEKKRVAAYGPYKKKKNTEMPSN